MLPRDLLSLTSHDRETSPRYLTERDAPWVTAVAREVASWVGHTLGARARGLRGRVFELAAEHGLAPRLVEGVLVVLSRTYGSEIACRRDPVEVRSVTFEEAALEPPVDRSIVLGRAALRLGLQPAEVEAGLFADRERERRIVSPILPASTGEAMDAYNLALVTGLLAASTRMVIDVDAAAHGVIHFAKRGGLLCTWAEEKERLRVDVSGPLSILRHTAKYGRTLARFFPALLQLGEFRLTAHCSVRDEPVTIHVTSADPLFRHGPVPAPESVFQSTLARDIERLGTGWKALREHTLVLRDRALHPSLVLRRGEATVMVEIIRFSGEHLDRKLESFATGDLPTIVCLDESVSCDMGPPSVRLLRFRKTIDAATLVNAADSLVRMLEPAAMFVGDGLQP